MRRLLMILAATLLLTPAWGAETVQAAVERFATPIEPAVYDQPVESLIPLMGEWSPLSIHRDLIREPEDRVTIKLHSGGQVWATLTYTWEGVRMSRLNDPQAGGLGTCGMSRRECGHHAVDGCESHDCRVDTYEIKQNDKGEDYCSYGCKGGGICDNLIGTVFCVEREPPKAPVTGRSVQDNPDPYGRDDNCGDALCLRQ